MPNEKERRMDNWTYWELSRQYDKSADS